MSHLQYSICIDSKPILFFSSLYIIPLCNSVKYKVSENIYNLYFYYTYWKKSFSCTC